MVKFNDYEHFKRYCYATARNKKIKLNKTDYMIFDRFEILYSKLLQLKEENKIEIEGCLLNKLFDFCKNNMFDEAIYNMNLLNKKYNSFLNNEIDFYFVHSLLANRLNFYINFTENFINEENIDDKYFPSRIKVLELHTETIPIYPITSIGNDSSDKPGVYCIYDCNGNLGYVGRSINCVKTRALMSSYEQRLSDFSKIELRVANTQSDACVYEYYYIAKLKPNNNYDGMCNDILTISLPELNIYEKLVRDADNPRFISYTYGKRRVYDISNALNRLGNDIVLETIGNKQQYANKIALKEQAYKRFYELNDREIKYGRYFDSEIS